jgi:NAD(P)-dependent dehydrogenase (short-subunit alcohol dehydrogenase family)
MSLKDKTIVVTGGSRGLGLGLVEALVNQCARVTVVARDQAALAAVKQRLGVAVIPADVTGEGAAQRILADVRPEILIAAKSIAAACSRTGVSENAGSAVVARSGTIGTDATCVDVVRGGVARDGVIGRLIASSLAESVAALQADDGTRSA